MLDCQKVSYLRKCFPKCLQNCRGPMKNPMETWYTLRGVFLEIWYAANVWVEIHGKPTRNSTNPPKTLEDHTKDRVVGFSFQMACVRLINGGDPNHLQDLQVLGWSSKYCDPSSCQLPWCLFHLGLAMSIFLRQNMSTSWLKRSVFSKPTIVRYPCWKELFEI